MSDPQEGSESRSDHQDTMLIWRDRFARYFVSNGLALTHNPSPPDSELLREMFSEGGLLHHPDLTDEELEDEIQELWSVSYDQWMEARVQAISHWTVIDFMAASRSLVDDLLAEPSCLSTFEELIGGARLSVVQSLVRQDLWRSPYILLIERDFPGSLITDSEIEEFARQAEIDSEAMHRMQLSITNEMAEIMARHSYDLESHEVVLLIDLSYLVMRHRKFPTLVLQMLDLRSTAQTYIQRSRQPDHPAWVELLDRLFRAWEE